MNRQERRRARNGKPRPAGLPFDAACTDCNSDQRLVDVGGGVFVLEIAHDATCPVLSDIERRNAR